MQDLLFEPGVLPASTQRLRRKIRAFLTRELAPYGALERSASWDGVDAAFSRRMGAAGFIGITIPKIYGGQGGSIWDRYVVLEETLAAGAPTGFHWFADRQSGPLLVRFGSEAQRHLILPRLCRGELCFCIGMSEPDAGSDLAALRTQARWQDDHWVVNGSKLWTTNAHRADYMIALIRTAPAQGDRRAGLSQFLIDLRQTPGIRIQPVADLARRNHFNEVVFEDAPLPADSLIGQEGEGWAQVNAELALERSGPERYLSCHVLLTEFLTVVRGRRDPRVFDTVGRLVARLATLRSASLAVTGRLARQEDASLQAALVKDLGAEFEQSFPTLLQDLVNLEPTQGGNASDYQQVLASLMILAPSFSLRGGSVEILRGIIARGLGLR